MLNHMGSCTMCAGLFCVSHSLRTNVGANEKRTEDTSRREALLYQSRLDINTIPSGGGWVEGGGVERSGRVDYCAQSSLRLWLLKMYTIALHGPSHGFNS